MWYEGACLTTAQPLWCLHSCTNLMSASAVHPSGMLLCSGKLDGLLTMSSRLAVTCISTA